MKETNDLKLEQEKDSDCPICFESLNSEESESKLTLFLCCATSSSLKALHAKCAEDSLGIKPECPCCRAGRAEGPKLKYITVGNEIFNQLKDFYFFLCENKLSSPEYFDDSSLSVKLQKLLDDNVSTELMLSIIEKYIEMKKDINATEENGSALFTICSTWPKTKIPMEIMLLVIDKLLEAKANMKTANNKGWTALHVVCSDWQDNVPIKIIASTISKFLETNALDINAATIGGWTALHLICMGDWAKANVDHQIILAIIDEFLKAKANVNAVTDENWTALHFICRYWPENKIPAEMILTAIDKFLEAGIDVNTVTNNGWSVLHCICCYWPEMGISHEMILAVIGKLLTAGIKVDATNKTGKTALEYLKKINTKNLLQNIKLLQAASAEPSKIKYFYLFLLQNNLNSQEYFNDFPLPVKMAKLLTEIISPDLLLTTIEKFIAMGMDVNATDEKNHSCLPYIYNALTEKKISPEIALTIIENLFVAGFKIAENEKKQFKKIWKQLNKNALRLQKFKTSALDESDDYHYPLAFARLYRATQSSTKEPNEGYQRVIELLLKPRRHFAFSKEKLQILEEIYTFDKQLLSFELTLGLHLLFTKNIVKADGNKAQQYFFQAAKAGWLVGYVLAAHQCERGVGVAKNLDQAIEYYKEVIFSKNTVTNDLNKKCFNFALKRLHKLANKKEPDETLGYCAALTTASPSEIAEVLKNLIFIAPATIDTDKTVTFKIIFALADFIDFRKDLTALQTPLLLKLIHTLKLEKLFLETSMSKLESPNKFKLFAHKSAPKPNFSTDYARALRFLIDENQHIETIPSEKTPKFMQFYAQISKGKSELPEYLVDKEICKRAEQILEDLEKNLSKIPDFT